MTDDDNVILQAIVRVGDGRGFIVARRRVRSVAGYRLDQRRRFVITAAHCLPIGDDGYPKLPPAMLAMDLTEKTYRKLLGALDAEPSVWCECLFVNPVDDIAVLGRPDNQEFYEEADAYDTLVDSVKPLVIADAPQGEATAYLPSLDGEQRKCTVTRNGINLSVQDGELVVAGMSGSPIISTDGKAIALVSMGSTYNPVLRDNLPAWFFRR
jgi:hypothetical protein